MLAEAIAGTVGNSSSNSNGARLHHATAHESPLVYRQFLSSDVGALKYLHDALFPIDYDVVFFSSAVEGNGILGYAAVAPIQEQTVECLPDSMTVFVGAEQLVGFITARQLKIADIPSVDRQLLGLGSSEFNGPDASVMYILTLGVVNEFRNQGIATALLQRVEAEAARQGCVALYLHVISYNTAARNFYGRLGFEDVALLPNFYFIQTGRALHPDVKDYDAMLLKKSQPLPLIFKPSYYIHRASLWSVFNKLCLLCINPQRHRRSTRGYNNSNKSESEHEKKMNAARHQWLRRLFTGGPKSILGGPTPHAS